MRGRSTREAILAARQAFDRMERETLEATRRARDEAIYAALDAAEPVPGQVRHRVTAALDSPLPDFDPWRPARDRSGLRVSGAQARQAYEELSVALEDAVESLEMHNRLGRRETADRLRGVLAETPRTLEEAT
jgi:hypothetical protein